MCWLIRVVALDIKVVHEIVTTAQERLDRLPVEDRLPTNELFQAYDAVLPSYGIDPEEDQHLSRLVFRIGGERGDSTLLDKFRAVLSRMGIEIEFDNSGPVSQEPAPPIGDGGYSFPSRPLGLRPARTGSDTELSNTRHRSRPALQPRVHSISSSSGVTTEIADTARLIPGQSLPRSSNLARVVPASPPPVINDAQAASLVEGSEGTVSQTPDDTPDSEEVLEERATQLDEHRLASLVISLFKDWNDLAVEAEAREPPARSVSALHDTAESLLLQWKEYMKWKSATAEEASRKEAYNRWCDRLATRARQIYILATTFASWHQHAVYREERTAVARRHILRFRHFDSWKVLAVSEERAIRFFAQRLYLPRWVGRHRYLCQQDELASKVGRDKLLSRMFMIWRLGAFEKSAESRRFQRLRESVFNQWVQAAYAVEGADTSVRSLYRERTLLALTEGWRTRASCLRYQDANSSSRSQEATLSNTFHLWLSSRPERVNEAVCTTNILSKYFNAWHLESQVEALERKRDHRLVSETFISWTTLAKVAAFQSQRERALARTTFNLFRRGSEHLEAQGSRSRMLQASRRISHASLASLFLAWSQAAAGVKGAGDIAYNSMAEVAKVSYLNNWYGAVLHDAELERWARRGYSYLVVHGNFDLWKHWARREKERKLRATYTKAKHDANVRLVLGCWRTWKDSCDSALVIEGAAEGGCQSHDRGLLHAAMDGWVSSANYVTESDRRCQLVIIEGLFEVWATAAAEHADGESETAGLWIERLAETCWNRWDITHQWIGGQAYNAENAATRRDREMTTKLFFQWLGVAVPDRLEALDDGNRALPNLGRSDIASGAGRGRYQYTPARVQHWSRSNLLDYNARVSSRNSDNQDDELNSIVRGMNTPTRWSGRPRPLVGLSSTTPSGPLSTPYERELRIRYATNAGTIGHGRGVDTHDSGVSSEHVSGGSGGT